MNSNLNNDIGVVFTPEYWAKWLLKKYHSMGIGKKLFEEILKILKDKTGFIDVKASPYAEKIYSKFGFKK